MKRIGIYAKKHHGDAVALAGECCRWLQRRGCEVLLETELATQVDQQLAVDAEELPSRCDLLVVLGGDGTLLSVARRAYRLAVPILGVNLGNLGFLTEVAREEMLPVLDKVLAGDYQLSERMMLDARVVRAGREVARYTVLNDIVISKGALARIIELEASVNDKYLCNIRADGLIIATPTGSTGYNLSAGGPIISPGQNCLAIAPICPHSLTHRPIVVSGTAVIQLTAKQHDDDILVTADGQIGMPLQRDDLVELRRSQAVTRLIRSPYKDYFAILRTKLGWATRSNGSGG
jgi:NAD+ kinase